MSNWPLETFFQRVSHSWRQVAVCMGVILGGCEERGAEKAGDGGMPNGAEDDPACDEIEPVLEELLQGATPLNCGDLETGASGSAALEAQRCALKAHADGATFRVTYRPEGIDSYLHDAFVWTGTGPVHAVHFDHGQSGGYTTVHSCTAFAAISGCAPDAREDLCLECPGTDWRNYCVAGQRQSD